MFAKKLKGLGNEVGIEVLEGLPHGFLNFSLVSTYFEVILIKTPRFSVRIIF